MRYGLRITFAIFLIFFCFNVVHAEPPEWKIDWAHSSAYFDIRHTFATVRGQFNDISGKFFFDPENVTASRCSFEVKVKSIDTNIRKRDDHLRADDFFDAKKYPLMIFKSNGVRRINDARFDLEGKLTIKDVTQTVVIPFTYYGVKDNPLNPKQRVAGFEAKFTIDRLVYGVGDGKYYKMGAIGKDVDITITLEVLQDK